jgi:hypothetical protein
MPFRRHELDRSGKPTRWGMLDKEFSGAPQRPALSAGELCQTSFKLRSLGAGLVA